MIIQEQDTSKVVGPVSRRGAGGARGSVDPEAKQIHREPKPGKRARAAQGRWGRPRPLPNRKHANAKNLAPTEPNAARR